MNREPGLSAFADRTAVLAASATPVFAAAGPETGIDRRLRRVDLVLAIILLLLILPVMALIALAIRCTSAGPVIFAHKRVGRGGRMFPCLKFRSMTCGADNRLAALLAADPARQADWAQAHKLRRDPRVTRLGAFLRRSSLDELPQLLNVVRGDMSLVGPRPIVPAEMVRYGRYIHHYASMRPGITGLWQVSGRNMVSYPRRVALDVLFVRNRSTRLHLYILARTVRCIIAADGGW